MMLYVGAGTDVGMVSIFPDRKRFVFIDTLPRSEFDDYTQNEPAERWYRPSFLKELFEECTVHGFLFQESHTYPELHMQYRPKNDLLYYYPSLLIFHHPVQDRTIHYYVSTNISYPCIQQWSQLCSTLQEVTHIYVCGHFPNCSVLSYLSTPLLWYSASSYIYTDQPGKLENTVFELFLTMNDTEYRTIVKQLFLVDPTTHHIMIHPLERSDHLKELSSTQHAKCN